MTCAELGKYKTKLSTALRNSDAIKVMLLGENYETTAQEQNTDVDELLDNYVFSHLYVDGTVTETKSYIFYDVTIPTINSRIKYPVIFVHAICHRDILDNMSNLSKDVRKKYYGNRVDKMAQAIEENLLNEDIVKEFGIGDLELKSITVYTESSDFYGRLLTFSVPNFR